MMGILQFFPIILFISFSLAYNLKIPGLGPKEYEDNEIVPLKVNSLTSTHTQLPYPFYSLPFCQPDFIEDMVENLGEILTGDRIENSRYAIYAGKNEPCKVLCRTPLNEEEVKAFMERISEQYRVHWLLDNLPAATKKPILNSNGNPAMFYEDGFPLGDSDKGTVYLNNHVDMNILFNSWDDGSGILKKVIVGFEIEPKSIHHEYNANGPEQISCSRSTSMPQTLDGKPTMVTWTYSVNWEYKDVDWTHRWDVYLLMTDDQIHWFSIVNSLMIVLFLTGMVAMIMMRTLRADLKRYREMENAEEPEETGWKLVHGDVFRPPAKANLLSVFVGTGVQVFSMAVITMVFATLGFLSPANRGGLMTAMVVLFVVMGFFAGYFAARTYKLFNGQHWKQNMILTALLFPGIVFALFLFLNLVLAYERSSGAVPFGTLVALIALWFGISVPLVFFGSYFGFRKPADQPPVRTNQIPRQIPDQVWYMKPFLSILMGGILPFGAVFIELFFILSSIWLHQFYYIFGFLAIVFIILILTCAEITIVMCYFQLCSEDYHWWWRAFLTSGTSALYMFLYSIFYFFTKLQINKFVSILLYFGYTLIMALGFFLLTGSIGFYACYFFVRTIYASVKVE